MTPEYYLEQLIATEMDERPPTPADVRKALVQVADLSADTIDAIMARLYRSGARDDDCDDEAC